MAKRRTKRIGDVLQKRRWSNSDAQAMITALRKSEKSSADFARKHKIKKYSRNKLPLVGKSGRAGISTSSDMYALCKLLD
jgi:hypothetical protein